MSQSALNLRNVVILVGLVVAAVGVIYFASEFIARLSDWGRVAALALLAVAFVALGRHFETDGGGGPARRRAWNWLRVTTPLYLLGLLATLTAVIVFLGIDGVDRLVKAAVTILAGLGLILAAAKWLGHGGADEPPGPGDAPEAAPPPSPLLVILMIAGAVIGVVFIFMILAIRGFA